jgi:hypothetical protein
VRKYVDFIEGTDGKAVRNAFVTVLNHPAGTNATLYSDASGLSVLGNPVKTDATGEFSFYVADGHYTLQITAPGLLAQTITDISIFDEDNLLNAASSAGASASAAAASATSASGSATAASGSASAAAGSASSASASASTASSQVSAAQAASRVFANTTAGLAGTTNGQYFYVVSAASTETLELWLNNAGVANDTGKRMPAGPALAKQPAVVASFAGVWKDRNLFNPATINAGQIQLNTGALSANASFYATDYIPVTPGKQIVCSAATPAASANAFAYFDYNFVFVSGSSGQLAANTPTTVPANAAYIRLTFANTVSTANLVIVQGSSVPTTYAGWGEAPPSAHNDARALCMSIRPKRQNLYDKAKGVTGHFINSTSGVSTAGVAFHTDYIPVTPGGQWTISPASDSVNSPAGLAYYDRSLTYVSGVAGPFTNGQVFTVPNNASFVRVTANNNQIDTLVILEGSQVPVSPAYHNPAFQADTASGWQWSGKSFTVLGDSISDPALNATFGLTTDWPSAVASTIGASVGLRAAKSGRTMVDALKDATGAALTSSSFTGIDLAILYIGTNDYGTAATPLGTLADSTATASFYGYTKKAIEQILTWKPTIKFAICTLMQRRDVTGANGAGATLADYSQALRNVANLYAIPICDLERISGLNTLTFNTFTADTILHPNQAGQTACITGPMLGFLRTVWPNS